MRSASILSPMHVAHMAPLTAGYRVCIGRRAGDSTSRLFLNGPAFPLIDNLPANPSAVSHALTPLDSGNWRRAIERTQTHVLALRRFIQPGLAGLLNFCRRLAGSSFRTLLQSFQESSRVSIVLLSPLHFADLFGLVAVFHGQEPSERKLKCPTSVLKGKSR